MTRRDPRRRQSSSREALDLDQEPVVGGGGATRQRPRRHRADLQDWTRLVLAIALVLPITLLGVAVPVSLIWLHQPPPEQVEDTVIAALGPLAGLAGAVLGFYFGERARRGR